MDLDSGLNLIGRMIVKRLKKEGLYIQKSTRLFENSYSSENYYSFGLRLKDRNLSKRDVLDFFTVIHDAIYKKARSFVKFYSMVGMRELPFENIFYESERISLRMVVCPDFMNNSVYVQINFFADVF